MGYQKQGRETSSSLQSPTNNPPTVWVVLGTLDRKTTPTTVWYGMVPHYAAELFGEVTRVQDIPVAQTNVQFSIQILQSFHSHFSCCRRDFSSARKELTRHDVPYNTRQIEVA